MVVWVHTNEMRKSQMQMATFWTYNDTDIQRFNIYASNDLQNYNLTKDPFWIEWHDIFVDRIQAMKCYDC